MTTWLKQVLDDYRVSVPSVAKGAGKTAAEVYRLANGERAISPKWADILATAINEIVPGLNMPPSYLIYGPKDGRLESPDTVGVGLKLPSLPFGNAGPSVPSYSSPKVIPVRGKGDFTLDFDGFILDGVAVDQVGCPPGLETVPDAYACRVFGATMESRFVGGDTVFVNPHLPVTVGDYVIVQVNVSDREAAVGYIKRLVSISGTQVVLEQSNPKRQIKLPKADVVSIHKIVFVAIR